MLAIAALDPDRGPMTDRDRGRPGGAVSGRTADASPDEASALFDAYGERIRRYIAFRVRSTEDADDLTSEVFRRFLSGPLPVDRAVHPAWLFKVAHNAVIDHYRRRRFTLPFGSLLDRPDDAPGLPEQAIRNERMAAVDQALVSLGGRQRSAIYLRFYEDLEYGAIATIMGIPAVTARTLVHRGLKRVAAQMAEADR
jgi:RNA polymerase sigma-70 factor, ECF subfamily